MRIFPHFLSITLHPRDEVEVSLLFFGSGHFRRLELGEIRPLQSAHEEYGWEGTTDLPFGTTQFLFTFQLFIESTHTRCARPCHCERPINFFLARRRCRCSRRASDVCKTLLFVFSYPLLPLLPCSQLRIKVGIWCSKWLKPIVLGRNKRTEEHTSVMGNWCKPLFFQLLVPPVFAPSVDPLLPLLIPLLPVPFSMRDTFRSSESFPFRRWFGLR